MDPGQDPVVGAGELLDRFSVDRGHDRRARLQQHQASVAEEARLARAGHPRQAEDLLGHQLLRVQQQDSLVLLDQRVASEVRVGDTHDAALGTQRASRQRGQQVDRVPVRDGEEQIGVTRCVTPQRARVATIAADGEHVQLALQQRYFLGIQLDQREVVPLADERLGDVDTHFARADNEDLHRGTILTAWKAVA